MLSVYKHGKCLLFSQQFYFILLLIPTACHQAQGTLDDEKDVFGRKGPTNSYFFLKPTHHRQTTNPNHISDPYFPTLHCRPLSLLTHFPIKSHNLPFYGLERASSCFPLNSLLAFAAAGCYATASFLPSSREFFFLSSTHSCRAELLLC